MAVVLRGQVTHTRAKAPSCAKRAGTPGLVVMWVRLSQQRVHGGSDQVGHRSALGGGELLQAAGLGFGQLNLGADHDDIT